MLLVLMAITHGDEMDYATGFTCQVHQSYDDYLSVADKGVLGV